MDKITLKGIIDEDFVNYRVPSMTLLFPYCDFKCDTLAGKTVCQNHKLFQESNIDVNIDELVVRYLNNPISKAWVFQGMEPFSSFEEMHNLIKAIRKQTNDDIVIYTGYTKSHLTTFLCLLKQYTNIIIKYGQFYPDNKPHYDEILGVYLASNNQYAERLV